MIQVKKIFYDSKEVWEEMNLDEWLEIILNYNKLENVIISGEFFSNIFRIYKNN